MHAIFQAEFKLISLGSYYRTSFLRRWQRWMMADGKTKGRCLRWLVLGKNAVCLYAKEERRTGGGLKKSRYHSPLTLGFPKLIKKTSSGAYYHIGRKMKRGLSDFV
ncbi:uncharacterized protein LOC116854100 [Odontomachus brunneus]|uniref:uncharacterized protein LOC116854100 n=1 Tax=Odontomachus brunneus TaxID=486640 RepID=UPI0013F293BB|nr:uncharacterized protein LOC116854100 [Odontomachus brunneus]